MCIRDRYQLRQLGGDTGRSDLVHLSVILRVEIEEFVIRNHLGQREDNLFTLHLIATACHFRSIDKALENHLTSFPKRLSDSGLDSGNLFHLRHAKTTTPIVWFQMCIRDSIS